MPDATFFFDIDPEEGLKTYSVQWGPGSEPTGSGSPGFS